MHGYVTVNDESEDNYGSEEGSSSETEVDQPSGDASSDVSVMSDDSESTNDDAEVPVNSNLDYFTSRCGNIQWRKTAKTAKHSRVCNNCNRFVCKLHSQETCYCDQLITVHVSSAALRCSSSTEVIHKIYCCHIDEFCA